MDKSTQTILHEIYLSLPKYSLPGKGDGFVNMASFGLLVNKKNIHYKGAKGKGKLGKFLLDSGLFEIVNVSNPNPVNYVREICITEEKPKEGPTAVPVQENTDVEKKSAEDTVEPEEPVVKTIFEEEEVDESSLGLSMIPHDISELHSNIPDDSFQRFNALRVAKEEDWKTFSKPDYIGIWKSIIEKYPETAHFIYELIQNADDAKATEVAIILYRDHLVFKHNGERMFTLTDPSDKNVDMGDINSITSVACSTKKDEEQTIGKFGVGFKSVFQYTEQPAIYDDTFWFRIKNYIIPELIDKDHEYRYPGETLFDIPFKNPDKAYNEILHRLKDMRMPVLFLPHVKRIVWKIDGEDRRYVYSKVTLQEKNRSGLEYQLCRLNECDKRYHLYLFKKTIRVSEGEFDINVGYFINPDGSLRINITPRIYCFFPTREKFEGCFVSHAPFLLTDNRDSIKAFEQVNNKFINAIADLAAEAILCLRDIGMSRNERLLEWDDESALESFKGYKSKYLLINDNLFALTNIKSTEERNTYLKSRYIRIIKNNSLVLSRSRDYVTVAQSLISTEDLEHLLSKEQLTELYRRDIEFVYIRNFRNDLRTLAGELNIETFNNETLASKLTSAFMKKQKPEWANRLLYYIKEKARQLWSTDKSREIYNYSYQVQDTWAPFKFRFAPIAMTSKGEWIAPYTLNRKDPNIMLPFDGFVGASDDDFGKILDKDLYESRKDLFDNLGLRRPNMSDYIEKVIMPHYRMTDIEDSTLKNDFNIIYKYLTKKHNSDIVKTLMEKWKMRVAFTDRKILLPIEKLSIPEETFIQYAKEHSEYSFVDVSFYASESYSEDNVISFLKRHFLLKDYPYIVMRNEVSHRTDYWSGKYKYDHFPNRFKEILNSSNLSRSVGPSYIDYEITGFKLSNISEDQSKLLWRYLIANTAHNFTKAELEYTGYRKQYSSTVEVDSSMVIELRSNSWIFIGNGVFCRPSDITKEQFHGFGYKEYPSLEEELHFCKDIFDSILYKDERERKEKEKRERENLIEEATQKGLDVNSILRDAISQFNEGDRGSSIYSHSNKDAIQSILRNLNQDDINKLAHRLESDSKRVISTMDIPDVITDNIDSLIGITDAFGEDNLTYIANHAGEIVDYLDNIDKPTSMVRRIINYIGCLIYEHYLNDRSISYQFADRDHKDIYDYKLASDDTYISIDTTLKSIIDGNIPIGLAAAQNKFMRTHQGSQFRIVRISIKDMDVVREYSRIIEIFGKETDPRDNERLREECQKLANNYWKGATIEQFNQASPEYAIKIERRN